MREPWVEALRRARNEMGRIALTRDEPTRLELLRKSEKRIDAMLDAAENSQPTENDEDEPVEWLKDATREDWARKNAPANSQPRPEQ